MARMLASISFLVVAIHQAPAVPPRDSAAAKPASAAISGLISEQGSGRPLSGALVTLWTASSQERSREVVADARGRYEITGIEPGEYTLFAGPGEYRATYLRQSFGQSGPMDVSMGMPRPNVELEPGDVRSDLNMTLTRALAIEGRVFDHRDQPMAEAEALVLHADGTPVPAMRAHSDDRGVFRLWGLLPGRYRVCATPRSRFFELATDTSRFVRTCHLASTSESNAVDVVLEAEDATGIDIRVQRLGTYAVSGSVVDASGLLADGAFVGASRDDREVSANDRAQNGRFVLKGLMPGRYLLHAAIGGPASPSDLHPPARERELGYATLVVDGSDVPGVEVQLSKGRRVPGRVVFEGSRAPRSSGLRMVVQARVADPAWSAATERPPFSSVNDRLEFELNGLFQLPLVVGIHGLPEGWALKEIRSDGRDITDLPMNFGDAPPRTRLDIVLTNRVAIGTVRVTDERGAPLTAYQVAILPADPNRWKGSAWNVPGSPSRDGAVKLGPLLPGDYLVAALSGEDYRVLLHNPARIESLAAVARRVTLVEGGNAAVELHLTKLPAAGER